MNTFPKNTLASRIESIVHASISSDEYLALSPELASDGGIFFEDWFENDAGVTTEQAQFAHEVVRTYFNKGEHGKFNWKADDATQVNFLLLVANAVELMEHAQ